MNKLPQKYENGIFNKIVNFFRKIFNKKVKESENIKDKVVQETTNKQVDNSINEMKIISKEKNLRDDILNIVKKKPEIVNTLQSEQLEKLDEMLDEEIEKSSKELERLQQKYEKIKTQVS